MTQTAPESRADAPPAPGDGLAVSGLSEWIVRAVSILYVATLVPSLTLAYSQLDLMDARWLVGIAGGILGVSAVMPFYAWSERGIGPPAITYAVAVLVGLVTWPFAWLGTAIPETQPWLWVCFVMASAGLAFTVGYWPGLWYLVACAAVYFVVRQTPSGGLASVLVAIEDTLLAITLPIAAMVISTFSRRMVAGFDDSRAAAAEEREAAAVQEALLAERARLDAIVHDEVMTTLVAAARSVGPHDDALAAQAARAVESLAAAGGEPDAALPVPADHVVRLIGDVVASILPTAAVSAAVTVPRLTLPHDAVSALAQATREACLNAARHAEAEVVTVATTVAGSPSRPSVMVVVRDDGRGFDPAEVPAERLGVRLSLVERMRNVGGTAEVASAPGAGCEITLGWAGAAPAPAASGRGRRAGRNPLAQRVQVAPFGYTAGVLMTAFTALGWLSLELFPDLGLAVAGLVVAGAITPVALSRLGRGLSAPVAWLVVAAVLVSTGLSLSAVPHAIWPGHTTWFVGASAVLLVLVRVGGRRSAAWAGGALFGSFVLFGAGRSTMDFVVALGLALVPLLWLGIVEWLIRWMWIMTDDIERAEAESDASAAANAAVLSKLVLREVWLTDLRAHVLPLFEKLADPSYPLTDTDRAHCLVTEGSLRDTIRAHNLTSPSLSLAILDARLRGVQVTLVDNRGSALPEKVRTPTLRHLERTVSSMAAGRIVARTAPEGYDEPVTIVAVDSAGTTTLTTVAPDGTIATRT